MQEMIRIALVLYLGHLLTDFVFQTSRMVGLKRAGKFRGYAQHGAVHYVAALVVGGFFVPGILWTWRFQLVVALLTVTHVGIDWCKISLSKRNAVADGTWGFTIDQVFHAGTVFLTAWWIAGGPPAAEIARLLGILRRPDNKILLLMVVYVAVIFGAGYLIRSLTRPLMRDLKISESHAQLSNAGMFIGWLERFLILSALIEHSPATAGLILAAKSIARYPEFKREQFAEYFLIGTLLSISAAILGGVVLLKVMHGGVGLP
jgi:Protein of unknown function (DUF3307)